MNIYAIPPLITDLILIGIGLFVFLKNRHSKLNILFSLFSFSMAFWLFGYTNMYLTKDAVVALKWARLGFVGIIFIPILAYHFIISFLNLKRRFVLPLIYLLSIPSLILSQTNYIYSGIKEHFWGYYPTAGKIYILFLLMFGILFTRGVLLLLIHLKKERGIKREQIKYVSLAFGLGTLGLVDYLIKYPIFNVYPFGYVCALLFTGIIALAIVRYHLMNITIFALRGVIFSIVYGALLALPMFTVFASRFALDKISIGIYALVASAAPFIYLFLRKRAEDLILKEQRHYQSILHGLSKTMIRIKDLEALLRLVVLTMVDIVKVSFAAIYLKEEEYNSYQLKNYHPKDAKERFQEFIPLDYSLINLLTQKKKPLFSEEVAYQDKINLDSGLIIPYVIEDSLLGFLVLGAKPKAQMYTSDDILVFETLSYSTSLAIENCIFWKEIEDRQRKARLQEMDTYSYSLAHEIDNPMQVILGQIEYIRDNLLQYLPEEKRKETSGAIDFILEARGRASGMVKAIREFGSPTTGELKPLKVQDVVESFAKLYLPQFKSNRVYFEKHYPDKAIYIKGEKPELMQILVIFANNAVHACLGTKENEKKITLRVETSSHDKVKISLKDNGYGIKKELLPVIFSSFTTTKASTEGTGMGLYNAVKIAEKHKGKIWAESEGEGKGATFFIELPVAKDVTEEDAKKEDKGKRLF